MFKSIERLNSEMESFDGKVKKMEDEATAKESQATDLHGDKVTAILEGTGTDIIGIDKAIRQLDEEVVSLRQAAKSLKAVKATHLEKYIQPIRDEVAIEKANLLNLAKSKEAGILKARQVYLDSLKDLGAIRKQIKSNQELVIESDCRVGRLLGEDRWRTVNYTDVGSPLYKWTDSYRQNESAYGVLGLIRKEVEDAFNGVK